MFFCLKPSRQFRLDSRCAESQRIEGKVDSGQDLGPKGTIRCRIQLPSSCPQTTPSLPLPLPIDIPYPKWKTRKPGDKQCVKRVQYVFRKFLPPSNANHLRDQSNQSSCDDLKSAGTSRLLSPGDQFFPQTLFTVTNLRRNF